MQRWVFGAVVALPCMIVPALADEDAGGANSVRVCDKTFGCSYLAPEQTAGLKSAQTTRGRTALRAARAAVAATAPAAPASAKRAKAPIMGSIAAPAFGAAPWVAEARRYAGMTGAQLGVKHRGLWCGEFLGRIAQATGLRTPANPNMAPDWASAGTRISEPRVGAIALVNRGRGVGHVGIVTGIDGNGNPIIISGNHNNRVVEIAYPRGSIAGYVWPQG